MTALNCVRVDGTMKPIEGSQFQLKADLVLLAMGFVSPTHEGMLSELGVALDKRGNVQADVDDLRLLAGQGLTLAATCGAASRWSSGRFARAVNAPRRSTRR